MKFTIPTSYDNHLVDKLSELSNKYNIGVELFGSLRTSVIGTTRPSTAIPDVDLKQLKKHTRYMESRGMEFNYVLNSPCMGNIEYTYQGVNKIRQFLRNLISSGVKNITVANPFLLLLIKNQFPDINLTSSIILNIRSTQELQYHIELGVKKILLSKNINRDFDLLRKITKIPVEFELLVNSPCLLDCPWWEYHANVSSHSSQESEVNAYCGYPSGFLSTLYCTIEFLKDPINILKSTWIRPEDIETYYNLGFNSFKFDGRGKNTEEILKLVTPYFKGEFEGNLLSLVGNKFIRGVYFLDNKKLDDFLSMFVNKKTSCLSEFCCNCNYCKLFAKKALRVNEQVRMKLLKEYTLRLKKYFMEHPKNEYNRRDKIWNDIVKNNKIKSLSKLKV